MAVNAFSSAPLRLSYFPNSEVILYADSGSRNVYRSEDAGFSWTRVDAVPEGQATLLIMHEYDPSRAYIMTPELAHYRTKDRGRTWESFFAGSRYSPFYPDVMLFHATEPDRIIYNGMDCLGIFCEDVTLYTLDNFDTDGKFLRSSTSGCWWAKSSALFTTGAQDLDRNRILCIVRAPSSPFKQDQRLLISDNFFGAADAGGAIQEYEPNLDMDKPAQGIVHIAVVQKFLLAATTSANTDEMALFVSDDSKKWHRAVFPTTHQVRQEAFTVLESTNYSIQVDVMTTRPSNPMGVLFTSNSNGTYFTENVQNTNRNARGHVDFEKIAGIQGIFLVNRVANPDDVAKEVQTVKKIVSEITFDDGRTFEQVTADGKRIHLHSVTELRNVGRVYSSPAPGLVMAVGNTGDALGEYWETGNLYVSDDAGMTWHHALDGPHKYEFGDSGSILLAVRDSKTQDVGEIRYSLTHGTGEWKTVAFPDGLKVRPYILTTTQDATSLKFILVGEVKEGDEVKYKTIAIDFDGLHEATCKETDLEDWWARVDDKKQARCLMGHRQKFQRRRKDAACFIKQEFKELAPVQTDCDCSDLDYECDFNFGRDDQGDDCVPRVPVAVPEGACQPGQATFKGPSGWRKIPGNTCRSKSGEPKEQQRDYRCAEGARPPSTPANDTMTHATTDWAGDWNAWEKHYLERGASSSADDETIIVRPLKLAGAKQTRGPISVTHDHGKTWTVKSELRADDIWYMIPHRYFKDLVFFLTADKTVWYTTDRGRTLHTFQAPYPAQVAEGQANPLAVHADKKDWLLWTGKKCEDGAKQCVWTVSWSKDRGDHWETGARFVKRCEFAGADAYRRAGRQQQEIVCTARAQENEQADNPLQLVTTDNWFDDRQVRLTGVQDFATKDEFIVVATELADKGSLQALASLDGQTFAAAHFPANFEVKHTHAFTVLDSSTHAVNLFVATQTEADRYMGAILKSNSNGTSYVQSISHVNCNGAFYVDFEKMLGLQGVALVNVVANADQVIASGAKKLLQTRITHNDGAQWAYLPPPAQDVDGKAFGCTSAKGDEKCALHLHGYTEREDHGKTYSSEGAVGYMFGWGNVGDALGEKEGADTFMTDDAGISWRHIRKGRYAWSFGDQGSVIVLVRVDGDTDEVVFSVDGGKTWPAPYVFSDRKVRITEISTLRSGGSRNFLLWGVHTTGAGIFTVNLDFAGFSERVCKHDRDDAAASDYDLWSPRHPMQADDCLFGHISHYLRKKADVKCYNDFQLEKLYSQQNCSCTRMDYEWCVPPLPPTLRYFLGHVDKEQLTP